jgi:predicted CXXCH cytochrome family protein
LPTAHYADNYRLSTLDWNLYFPDGQQQAEDYVLGSFMQSKMYQKGVTCTNCHDPHSGKLIAEGNAVCTQCHNETGREEFPSLKLANYDSPDHHGHPAGSAGAQCVSCHMPERTFMQVDGRRDHFFRIPDPLLSQKVGSPDSCLSCHTGKDADWAAAEIHNWSPRKVLGRSAYAELFDAVRKDGIDRNRLGELAKLAGDTSKPPVVRATALREIGDQADEDTIRTLSDLLADNNALVRSNAVRLWRVMPNDQRFLALRPLLSDPIRSVRIAAALELVNIPRSSLTAEQNDALGAALAELRASMQANADFPEGQMAIGGLAMTTRNWTAAEEAFAEAVFLDPQLVQAWLARASIAQALGNLREATSILLDARKSNPHEANINLQLAQLLLRQGRQSEAIPVLRNIVSANPSDQDVRITLALALLQTGDLNSARAEIDLLRTVSPHRAEILLLQGMLQVSSGDFAAAKETVGEIKSRYPNLRLPPQLDALSRLP